ncbi:MAG: hypothetical protein WEB60_07835 [Terrimicrobiaceae bacterium]
MSHLARHLQQAFRESCPTGWTCESEVGVVSKEIAEWLGYAPQADIVLSQAKSGKRIWIELEISRADPVANHAKFATAHLVSPMPPSDAFVSMVSRHVSRGRGNLAAHTVGLMRAVGIRAFQTPLFPEIDGPTVKLLNHMPMESLRAEALPNHREIDRAVSVATSLGAACGQDIHFVANPIEVAFNIYRWNTEMADPENREIWRRRPVRYFVHDPRTGTFAPSKFAAYLLLPQSRPASVTPYSLTGMSVKAYTAIDQDHPLFDGNRAWRHLHHRLGMDMHPLSELTPETRTTFSRWADGHTNVVAIDNKGPVILSPKPWQ